MWLLLICRPVLAETPVALYESFAGNINFVGTQKTLRGGDNNDPCSVVSSGAATLSGVPAGATLQKAYLYWAGSGSGDYTVTFDGNTVTASRQYTYVTGTRTFFSGVADVTAIVATNPNRSYSLSGLSVTNTGDHCTIETVLSGWALAVIYSHSSEDFRVINLYEGFQNFQHSSITLTPSNFKIPVSPINGKHAHITWEGDIDLTAGGEDLTFNGNELTDATNLSGNQFNSKSTITGTPDNNSWGVDFDTYNISAYLSAGQTSATTTYSSGQDRVLLSAEIISVTNTPVADLAIGMAFGGTMQRGTNVTYTLTVSNNGPNTEPGAITVTDTLPAGLTYVSATGSGWSCGVVGQVVTCTRAGSLASGASANAITLTATVASTATGTITNSATVSGTAFDNVAGNTTATDSQEVATADLAISMARSTELVTGRNATYTLSVSNVGVLTETAVTVTDTLPSGLSFVSASGSGWTCNSTVVCTYSGSLAGSGATAPPITLIATVASSGSITNTATVAGVQYETNNANNTASDTATAMLQTYAYYAMNEASWNGTAYEVKDSSGNTNCTQSSNPSACDGTAINSVTTVAAPAASLNKGDTCRGATIPTTTGTQAINTGIDVNSIGNAGSIAFWYRSDLSGQAWDQSNNLMLFDASNNLGNNSADKHFYLVKDNNGALIFALEDNADVNSTAQTGSYSFAANTWHHIAVTWNLPSDRVRIYVDGTLAATSTTNVNGTLGNTATLYIGDQRMGGVGGTAGSYSTNSAAGSIDELRIYNVELSAADVTLIKSYAQACSTTVDHYELSLATSGVACLATTVTVTARDAGNNAVTTISGSTSTLSASAGTLGTTNPVFNASGVATTTLSYPTAADGALATVTLSKDGSAAATYAPQCCPDGANCAVGGASSCTITTTFNTTGFVFSAAADSYTATVPTQIAGVASGNYYLRAIKSNTSSNVSPSAPPTAACQSALTGSQLVNFAYECVNPATCYGSNLLSMNGGGGATTISRNNSGSVSSYTALSLTFDANGNAPFTFNYSDVGQIKLWASKAASGSLLSNLTGSTNAFVVQPYGFKLSGLACDAADVKSAAAGAFCVAGGTFTGTVTPVIYDSSQTNNLGAATPSFGHETAAQTVSFSPSTLVMPTIAAGGTLSAFTSATVGNFGGTPNVATATMVWPEAGTITIKPTLDYLSTGDISAAGLADSIAFAGNVGRFYPDHFTLASASVTAGCSSLFTYMGQPNLGLTYTIAARNKSNVTTGNYIEAAAGGYDNNTGTSGNQVATVAVVAENADAGTDLGGRLGGMGTAPTWTSGQYAVSAAAANFSRDTAPDGPFDALAIGVRLTDADAAFSGMNMRATTSGTCTTTGAATDCNAVQLTTGTTKVRYGRLKLDNALGSERLSLPVKATAQYWHATNGWMTNADDTCTLPATAPTLTAYGTNTTASACFSTGTCSSATDATLRNVLLSKTANDTLNADATTPSYTDWASGTNNIVLAAPTAAATGSLTISEAVPAYLKFNWKGAGDVDPTAKATFGVYKGNNKFIYIREQY